MGRQLLWVDRDGRDVGALGDVGWYGNLELSPNGGHVAVQRATDEPGSSPSDIWLIDTATGAPSRFTFSREYLPRWSADGSRIAMSALGTKLVVRSIAGSDTEETLHEQQEGEALLNSWSPDGKSLLYRRLTPGRPGELWMVRLDGSRMPRMIPQTEQRGTNGRFSPDGQFIAYSATESGRTEIYVQPFPPTGVKWQVSSEGGARPRWRSDGRELYYLDRSGTLVAVPITARRGFQFGKPLPLFPMRFVPAGANQYPYDVSRDGQRFLIISDSADALLPLTVVVNWWTALEK
jgi:Tol biopolymer transport system component